MRWASVGIAVFVAAAIAGGCAGNPYKSAPSKAQEDEARASGLRGEPPANAEEMILAHLRQSLFDPDSLKDFSCGAPEEAWIYYRGSLLAKERVTWCWRVTAEYNAKNRYGGYTGRKPTTYYFLNNEIIMID